MICLSIIINSWIGCDKLIAGIGDVSRWSCHAPAALVHLTAHPSLNLFAVCWEVK